MAETNDPFANEQTIKKEAPKKSKLGLIIGAFVAVVAIAAVSYFSTGSDLFQGFTRLNPVDKSVRPVVNEASKPSIGFTWKQIEDTYKVKFKKDIKNGENASDGFALQYLVINEDGSETIMNNLAAYDFKKSGNYKVKIKNITKTPVQPYIGKVVVAELQSVLDAEASKPSLGFTWEQIEDTYKVKFKKDIKNGENASDGFALQYLVINEDGSETIMNNLAAYDFKKSGTYKVKIKNITKTPVQPYIGKVVVDELAKIDFDIKPDGPLKYKIVNTTLLPPKNYTPKLFWVDLGLSDGGAIEGDFVTFPKAGEYKVYLFYSEYMKASKTIKVQ